MTLHTCIPLRACLVVLVAALIWTPQISAEGGDSATPSRKGLQQRIDFGNAHILGQSIKSGAVYLMHRKKSDIQSMIKVRRNYREEIKEDFGLEHKAKLASKTGGAENDENKKP